MCVRGRPGTVRIRAAWAAAGLCLDTLSPAMAIQLAASGSTWCYRHDCMGMNALVTAALNGDGVAMEPETRWYIDTARAMMPR